MKVEIADLFNLLSNIKKNEQEVLHVSLSAVLCQIWFMAICRVVINLLT